LEDLHTQIFFSSSTLFLLTQLNIFVGGKKVYGHFFLDMLIYSDLEKGKRALIVFFRPKNNNNFSVEVKKVYCHSVKNVNCIAKANLTPSL
jgi:hypothetical protein